MASITWYGNFNGTSAGPSGQTTNITSSGTIPSNAVITSITCSVNVSAGWTNTSFYWTLHWFHVYGSDTAAYIGTIGVNNSAGVSYQCSHVSSGGTSRDVTATLTPSYTDMFKYYTTLTVDVKANIPQSGSPTTYMNAVSVTVNYDVLSLIAPSNLKICDSSSYTGTFGRFTWNNSSWSDGGSHGTIYYKLLYLHNGTWTTLADVVSSGYVSGFSSSEDSNLTVCVEAYSGGYSARSGSVTFNYRPLITPTLYIEGSSSYSGSSASITWTAASVQGTESSGATIYYELSETGSHSVIYTGTNLSYNYSDPSLSIGDQKVFRVYAHTSSPSVAVSDNSNTVTFIYQDRYISAPVLQINNTSSYTGPNIPLTWNTPSSTGLSGDITYTIYINGSIVTTVVNDTYITISSGISGYSNASIYITATSDGVTSSASNSVTYTYFNTDKTIKYFDGSNWVDCVMYYFDGSIWVKCEPYYFDGSNWVECSTI